LSGSVGLREFLCQESLTTGFTHWVAVLPSDGIVNSWRGALKAAFEGADEVRVLAVIA